MIHYSEEYTETDWEQETQFLSEHEMAELNKADENPFINLNVPDKRIPFVLLPDGGVLVDINANNPKTILHNNRVAFSANNLLGAGFMDVYHGNRTLLFRHIESSIFGKRWHVEEIASALQHELMLYYPGYKIRAL